MAPPVLAQGMLAHLAIERISIDPDTPIDRLLEFREQHHDELARFRIKVEELMADVTSDLPLEALRQKVLDTYNNEVTPAISDLKMRWQVEEYDGWEKAFSGSHSSQLARRRCC